MSLEIMRNAVTLSKKTIFERHLVKLGPYITANLMNNLLLSEELIIYETPAGQIEYNISEGTKAIARISREMLMEAMSNVITLILGLLFTYRDDNSEGKILSIFSVVGIFTIIVVKFIMMSNAMCLLRNLHRISISREKTYVELLENLAIIKCYGQEGNACYKYRNKVNEWAEAFFKYKYTTICNNFIYSMLSDTFIVISVLMYITSKPGSNIPKVSSFLKIGKKLTDACSVISSVHQNIAESLTDAANMMEYMKYGVEDTTNKISIDNFYDKIKISNLTYSARGMLVFKEIDMELKRGEKVVLYGHNGSGKSSIFKLLLKFDSYKGDIFVDGVELRNLVARDYRSLITFVPQDTRLLNESIYSNLTFGNNRPYKDILAECKKLQMHESIMALPKGYNTTVGEFGKNINGGLRQKIFYARAFLRNTPIYLFDEPTNNLDERACELLMSMVYNEAYRNKTFLIICHDINIVNKFPKRYYFEDNKLLLEES